MEIYSKPKRWKYKIKLFDHTDKYVWMWEDDTFAPKNSNSAFKHGGCTVIRVCFAAIVTVDPCLFAV